MTVNTLGSHEQYRSSRSGPSRTVAEWLWPFLPGGIAVFSLSAVFWYHTHRDTIEVRAPLQHLYAGVYRAFGLAPSVMFFVLVVIWSAIWLVTGKLDRPFARLGRLAAMLVMLGIFLNIGDGGVAPAPNKGALGAWLAEHLVGTFGYVPSLIVVWAITFASLLLATDFCFHDAFERLRHRSAAPAPDAGVEVAVTDHLRGLSTAVAPPAAAIAPVHAAAAAIAEPEIAPLDVEADPAAEPAPQSEPAPSRRRSYFERRAEREGVAAPPAPTDERAPHRVDPPIVPADEPLPEPLAELLAERGEQPSEPAAAAAADLAIDDALPLDPPLDPAGVWPRNDRAPNDLSLDDEPSSEAIAARAEVYETPEAIDAEDVLDAAVEDADTDAEASGGGNGSAERWVPIPRPEPARAVEPGEAVVEQPFADEPVDTPVAEPVSEIGMETAAVDAEIAPQPALRAEPEPEPEPRVKQKRLFGGGLDDGLVQDAIDVVTASRRASAAFLQRKLRIDYALAVDVLAELAARGVVALEGDSTQARVLG